MTAPVSIYLRIRENAAHAVKVPLLLAGLASSPAFADTNTGSTIAAVSDTKAVFTASGTLITTDTTNNGIDGPSFTVRDPDAPPSDEDFWSFQIKHRTEPVGGVHWDANGAKNVQICIAGTPTPPNGHRDGPHPPDGNPPDVDTDPNELPLRCSAARPIPFGVDKQQRLAVYLPWAHPTNHENHFDHYAIKSRVTAFAGGGNQLTGPYEILATHTLTDKKPPEFRYYALGSSQSQGNLCSYDVGSGLLSFTIGAIDIMDGSGGQTGAVDPAFANDPALGGQLVISPFTFLGQDIDGSFRFQGGAVVLVDPAGKFHFEGTSGEYRATQTDVPLVGNSWRLESVGIADVDDPAEEPSEFLERFVSVNLLGEGIPTGERLRMDGIAAAFSTPTDLVAATSGFTQSATVSATILIGPVAATIPKVPSMEAMGVVAAGILMMTVGMWWLLHRRHASRG